MYLFVRLCDIVGNMHNHNIFHLDIKPHNILVGENVDIQLTDLTLYQHLDNNTNIVTTKNYRPPEYYNRKSSNKTDNYALYDAYAISKTIQSMISGKSPSESIKNIKENFKNLRFYKLLKEM
jgi:serine/threonine-protein kinase